MNHKTIFEISSFFSMLKDFYMFFRLSIYKVMKIVDKLTKKDSRIENISSTPSKILTRSIVAEAQITSWDHIM